MPELSNERLAEMIYRAQYQSELNHADISSALTELQQRRASVVTPEVVRAELERMNAAGCLTVYEVADDRGLTVDEYVDLFMAVTAALSVVSHETGDGETMPKPKEWYARKATMEGDLEVGAGLSALPPPAFNGCNCSCHRGSGIIHMVACCAPAPTDETQGVKRDDEDRLPTRAEAAHAAAVLIRCNGHDLDVWTDGEWPSNTDFLDTLVHNHDQ